MNLASTLLLAALLLVPLSAQAAPAEAATAALDYPDCQGFSTPRGPGNTYMCAGLMNENGVRRCWGVYMMGVCAGLS